MSDDDRHIAACPAPRSAGPRSSVERAAGSAVEMARTALESRLRLLQADRLCLEPDLPPPPPPQAGWARRLGDSWPAVCRLALQWALDCLQRDRSEQADLVLRAAVSQGRAGAGSRDRAPPRDPGTCVLRCCGAQGMGLPLRNNCCEGRVWQVTLGRH